MNLHKIGKIKPMPYATKFDSNICYKASQCTDINDLETALGILSDYRDNLLKLGLMPGRSFYIRKYSLERKLKRLFMLSVSREQ